jgi:hypothetical protein
MAFKAPPMPAAIYRPAPTTPDEQFHAYRTALAMLWAHAATATGSTRDELEDAAIIAQRALDALADELLAR